MEYIYNKLFSKYLLKILFFHEDISNVEVMYLKKSISSLLFTIIEDEEVLSNVLKYHFDLRHIYDYTIKVTKIHVLGLIESNEIFKNLFQLNKDKIKGRHMNEHEKQAKANQGALHIIKIVGSYTEYKNSSKLVYRPDLLILSED